MDSGETTRMEVVVYAFNNMRRFTIAAAVIAFTGCAQLPSDGDVMSRFEEKRESFEKLCEMSRVDVGKVAYVEYDRVLEFDPSPGRYYVDYPGGQSGLPDGWSRSRWDAYRSVMRDARVVHTIGIWPKPRPMTLFIMAEDQLFTSLHRKGVACVEAPPSVAVTSLDGDLQGNILDPYGTAFRKIDDKWYVFYEASGVR